MNHDTRAQTAALLDDALTTSVYAPVLTSTTCEDYFGELLDKWMTNP